MNLTGQDLHIAAVVAIVAFIATLIERSIRRHRGLPV